MRELTSPRRESNVKGAPNNGCPQRIELTDAANRPRITRAAGAEGPSLSRAMLRLIWPPLLVVVSPLPAIVVPGNDLANLAAAALVGVSLLFVLTYGLFNSFAVARSLYVGRERAARPGTGAVCHGRPPRLLGLGLYFGQLTFFLSACSYFLKEYVFAYG